MAKTLSAKLAVVLLTLASCLVSASGPVRISNAPQEDIVEVLEHRGGCLSGFHHRRPSQHKKLLLLLPRQTFDQKQAMPVLAMFNCQRAYFWQSSPPILRGPPV
jgi:hypothetical protein